MNQDIYTATNLKRRLMPLRDEDGTVRLEGVKERIQTAARLLNSGTFDQEQTEALLKEHGLRLVVSATFERKHPKVRGKAARRADKLARRKARERPESIGVDWARGADRTAVVRSMGGK